MTTAYDAEQYLAAARLQQASPDWLIIYGPWTRRYFAFPTFHAPPGTILSAPSTAVSRSRGEADSRSLSQRGSASDRQG